MESKRLIDANALRKKALADIYSGEMFIYLEDLDEAPTVDAVEVVRCKDCKHREDDVCHLEPVYDFPWYYTNDDDFCSRGERKDNERKAD